MSLPQRPIDRSLTGNLAVAATGHDEGIDVNNNINIVRLLFGSQSSEKPGAGADSEVHTFSTAPHEAVDALNELVQDTQAEWLAIRSGTDWDEGRCRQLLTQLGTHSGAEAVMAISPSAESRDALWETLDAAAILVAPPRIDQTILLKRAAMQSAGGFEPVDDPLWDAVIRLQNRGAALQAVPIPDIDGAPFLLPDLAPAAPPPRFHWLADRLRALTVPEGLQQESDIEWTAFQAGLLQVHDFLDESHQKSQSIEGRGSDVNGDYWHAIMHRREPDYGNSKYWFRRVGRHPIFSALAESAGGILSESPAVSASHWRHRLCGDDWDAMAFVDLCSEASRARDADLKTAAERIQWREMCLLLSHTWRAAVAS